MGNEASKSNARLGVSAMAFTTQAIEADEMRAIAEALKGHAESGMCSRADFEEALKTVEKFEESDMELFNRLFIMFDRVGCW